MNACVLCIPPPLFIVCDIGKMPLDLECNDFWDSLLILIEMAYKDKSLCQILHPYVIHDRKTLFCRIIKLHANPQFTAVADHLLDRMYTFCANKDEENFNNMLSLYDAQMKKFLYNRTDSQKV